MWNQYISVSTISEALEILSLEGEKARIIAGATDLMLELERGTRNGIDTLIDITRIPQLDQIYLDEDDIIHIGPLVTHNQCVSSNLIREKASPLSQACWQVGSPQIRNRGTVVGNLVTASPANDTIPPLIALNADVTIHSTRRSRIIPLASFYSGVRKTILKPDEIVIEITFPAMKPNQYGVFVKYALRKAQAISLVSSAILLTLHDNNVISASIALGAVAPTIIHAQEAEDYLIGKSLTVQTVQQASLFAKQSVKPISDIRSSAEYRRKMVEVMTRRGLNAILSQSNDYAVPANPVLLWGKKQPKMNPLIHKVSHSATVPIETIINGKNFIFYDRHKKSLLRLLREDAGVIGTKEGCAEGECGACTVFMDGVAVMSCLVPAARAHLARITTIEGLSNNDHLHPIQEAFIQEGAVQCGYCTPGFLMSAAKLLDEKSSPTRDEINQAMTGNLCRCTGYYSIIRAIEKAARK